MVTTHLSPLKAFAQGREGVMNASMRFDLATLRPTYELVLGVPGRSYAPGHRPKAGPARGRS
jgi:DNA mismatch repair protein MutS2